MPEKTFRNRLINEVTPKANEKILEFGFGTGQNLIIGIERSPESKFRGLDIDPKVKIISEKKLEEEKFEIPLHIYDGGKFPFKNDEFDQVYSSLVFHQLAKETEKDSLKEIYRTLKTNGLLIFGDWGKPKSKFRRFLFYAVRLLDGFKTTQENVEGLLPKYMSECGFENVKKSIL